MNNFFFKMALKTAGSALNIRVGRVSGNTRTVYALLVTLFVHFNSFTYIYILKGKRKYIDFSTDFYISA